MNPLRLPLTAFAALSLSCLCSCDQSKQAEATPAPKKEFVAPPFVPRFNAACDLITSGKYDEAAEAFTRINAENDPSRPLYDWIIVHKGLALMMAGKNEDARKLFAKLEDAGPFSDEKEDKKLAKFFLDLAHAMRTEDPISADMAKDVDKWSFDALRLLFAALKDWNQEKFDDALPLMRQFFSSTPPGPALWIGSPEYVGQLKKMAGEFADDFTQYHEITDEMAKAKTPEAKKDVIEKAKTVRAEMKFPNQLTRQLDNMIADLNPKIVAAIKEDEKLSSEAEAADIKAFAGAKEKGDALMKQFKFSDAKKAYLEPDLKQSDRIAQQSNEGKKAGWLASFKSNLIKDITHNGYKGAMNTAAGAAIDGSAVKADDEQVDIKTPRGVVPAHWTDLSKDSIFTMAQSFILPDTPPDIASFRKWQLGVYAAMIGKKAESAKLLKEAAEIRPVFQPELAMFQDSGAK